MVCLDTGKVLASKSGFEKMFPASMTKIMTVLTARIYISDEHLDDVVKLSYNAKAYDLKYGCSSAGYEEGETLTVRICSMERSFPQAQKLRICWLNILPVPMRISLIS